MSFLKLRLAIERAIRAKEDLGLAPIRIAVVGDADDQNVRVFINPPQFRDELKGSNYFQGSTDDLEKVFNTIWSDRGLAYHLNESTSPDIRFGRFSPDEFHRLQNSSSAPTTLTSYAMASINADNLSNIPEESYKYDIAELNTLLRALQYYVMLKPASSNFQISYYPQVVDGLRLAAEIKVFTDAEVPPMYSGAHTSDSVARSIVSYLGFNLMMEGPINSDNQCTIQRASLQDVLLQLDASRISIQNIRLIILQRILPDGLKMGREYLQILCEYLGLPFTKTRAHEICWDLMFYPDDERHFNAMVAFLKGAGFKDNTESISKNEKSEKITNLFNDINRLPQKPMEFIVETPSANKEEYTIIINSSTVSFAAIIKALWANHSPQADRANSNRNNSNK